MSRLFTTLLLLCSSIIVLWGQGPTWQEQVQQAMEGLPNGTEFSIGVFDGADVWKMGYRMENGQCVAVNNEERIFEIGSITKTFTATLIMKMAEDGHLSLSDPIDDHLPVKMASNVYQNQSVTVQDLITHTSGLSEAPPSFIVPALGALVFSPKNPNKNFKAKQYYRYLRKFELDYLPGIDWNYNNANYGLLGEIVAQANGTSWEEAVAQHVFEPLGMQHSYLSIDASNENRFITGITEKGKASKPWEMKFINAAGAIKSTVNDMLVYTMTQLQASNSEYDYFLATHESLDYSIRMPAKSLWGGNAMGLGWWHTVEEEEESILWHGGATGGYSSFAGFTPETGHVVVVLSNISSGHPASRAENRMPIPTYLGQQLLRAI